MQARLSGMQRYNTIITAWDKLSTCKTLRGYLLGLGLSAIAGRGRDALMGQWVAYLVRHTGLDTEDLMQAAKQVWDNDRDRTATGNHKTNIRPVQLTKYLKTKQDTLTFFGEVFQETTLAYTYALAFLDGGSQGRGDGTDLAPRGLAATPKVVF